MAYQSIWFFTELPKDVIEIVEKDVADKFDPKVANSKLNGNVLNTEIRNSNNAWIPTAHWIGGFLWHYVERANRENFLYDITCIDEEALQYTKYNEGMFYGWHNDAGISNHYKPTSIANIGNTRGIDFINQNAELVRKISFSLQLSNPDDYEGGNLELVDESGKSYIAPRQQGNLILFDSRTRHRVTEITKGVRKSIVGWVIGSRWK